MIIIAIIIMTEIVIIIDFTLVDITAVPRASSKAIITHTLIVSVAVAVFILATRGTSLIFILSEKSSEEQSQEHKMEHKSSHS
jgi:hypothetical protein